MVGVKNDGYIQLSKSIKQPLLCVHIVSISILNNMDKPYKCAKLDTQDIRALLYVDLSNRTLASKATKTLTTENVFITKPKTHLVTDSHLFILFYLFYFCFLFFFWGGGGGGWVGDEGIT